MARELYRAVEACPVIAAVKDQAGLERILALDNRVVFVLSGDLLSIGETLRRLRAADKLAIVHLDLIQGLSGKEAAVDFLKAQGADGIITTKPVLIRRARELGLGAVLRFFIFDSLSLETMERTARECRPDLVEILPGIMPKIIARIHESLPIPLICGGLVAEKSDVLDALKAGALAVSTSSPALWAI